MTAIEAYSRSWNRRGFVLPIFLGTRLLSIGVVAPITGFAGYLAISLSDQSALTDQDIARFLLTPVGFLAGLGVVAVILVGSVIGFAAMSIDQRDGRSQGLRALRSALQSIGRRLPVLLTYAVFLTLRVLAVVLPFVVAGLLVANQLIGAYDINYYLSQRPPEFYTAAVVIAGLVAVMAALLVHRLLGWALSLHMVLFAGSVPRAAFSASVERMAGYRLQLLRALLAWLAVRLGLSFTLALVFGGLLQAVPGLFLDNLRTALTVLLVIAGIWTLAGLLVVGISHGALAGILNTRFGEMAPRDGAPLAIRSRSFSVPTMLAGAVAIAGFGLVTGGVMLDQVKTEHRVEIIAHRGAAGARPENTLASVRKAVEDQADWVEIDVQETADGEVVVIHDSDFMKLSGVDLKIWDATVADLAEIDIGSWYDPAYAAERTPTLAEILHIVRDRARLLIELKYYGHDVDLEARTVAIVEAAGMADQVATMSLKYPAVQKMRSLRPRWRAGVLAATAIGDLAGLEGDFIAINAAHAGSKLVADTDAAGKDLYVWTVNDPLEILAMASLGVDGIITDEPALAREVLELRTAMSPAERLALLFAERFGLSLPTDEYRDASP